MNQAQNPQQCSTHFKTSFFWKSVVLTKILVGTTLSHPAVETSTLTTKQSKEPDMLWVNDPGLELELLGAHLYQLVTKTKTKTC